MPIFKHFIIKRYSILTVHPLPPEVTLGHVEGAVSILKKYIAMLHKHATLVLTLATQVASISPLHFSSSLAVLQSGPCGLVIPELAVGMVLLLLRVPLPLMESDCVPLLGQLVEILDVFNRLAPEAQEENTEDLAWAESMYPLTHTNQNVQCCNTSVMHVHVRIVTVLSD